MHSGIITIVAFVEIYLPPRSEAAWHRNPHVAFTGAHGSGWISTQLDLAIISRLGRNRDYTQSRYVSEDVCRVAKTAGCRVDIIGRAPRRGGRREPQISLWRGVWSVVSGSVVCGSDGMRHSAPIGTMAW